ncbi:type VI secretion protein [Pandoraea cepalis]|uniref:Type VI secretion protein n=1 Tax=Pandoraea cepalis TaxID=2508294 RepID=A0AAW7MGV1_9BURK|nr:type VI secretion protein [Pandoraea cepalis]MDN4581329.1 type VI secretion protein [Pandoraea cepalis]
MVCKQNAMIWGFAVAVAIWRLLSTVTTATLRSPSGQGAATLATGPLHALMPLALAMLLTNTLLQGTVQIQSRNTGAVTKVDNVPLAISIIPAAASQLSMDLNEVFATAFQTVDMEYPTISATTNGFLNPLKTLLSARTAMVRLAGIDSKVKTVLSSCFGPDSGADYAKVQDMVLNTGNSGAKAAQSIPINGVNPTSLGALLYQASLNTTGLVNDVGMSDYDFLPCPDAAYKVADDITNALNSLEFTRVVQGAVNGMDQKLPNADYSFNSIAAQYNAIATANTLGGVFAGGAAQANAEFMNLLFAEMVQSDLNCLRAFGENLTQCQATALQAAEIERNNLQQAASEVPMLRYAGSFGNQLIALIIGLGPVILMLMMFAGTEAGKCVKTAAHIMVWPLLVVNVGAELVNAMQTIEVANFLQALRQGGWISQASTFAAYKELSLQIGVGSHVMASLPVLMSIIFGLGQSSAMTSVAATIAPKSQNTTDNVAPAPSATRPMFENSSIAQATQMANGQASLKMNGALDAVSASSTFGNMSRDASRSLTKAQTQTEAIEAGQQNLRQWSEAAQKHDFTSFGIDRATGEDIVKNWEIRRNASQSQHAGAGVTAAKGNENNAGAAMQLGISAGAGTRGASASVSGEISGQAATNAFDRLQRTDDAGQNMSYDDSKALSQAIHDTISSRQTSGSGQQLAKDLSQTLQTQDTFQRTVSEVKSVSDATSSALHDSSSFVQASAQIKAPEILWQRSANPEFGMFQVLQGRAFEESPSAQKYMQQAASDAARGVTNTVVNSPEGQQAVNRHRAAVLMAQDGNASVSDRARATQYLADEAQAMQHMRFTPGDTSMKNFTVGSPSDRTGVDPNALRGVVQRGTPALPLAAVQVAPTQAPRPTAGGIDRGTRVPTNGLPTGVPPGSNRAVPPPAVATSHRTVPAQPQNLPELDPAFKKMVESDLSDRRNAVADKVSASSTHSDNADLGEKGPGTVRRTASNVAQNIKDAVGARSGPSRTSLDRIVRPSGAAPEDPPQ